MEESRAGAGWGAALKQARVWSQRIQDLNPSRALGGSDEIVADVSRQCFMGIGDRPVGTFSSRVCRGRI